MSTHPHSLIAKYFGLHKLTLISKKGPFPVQKFYFVIMKNIFRTYRELHLKFDLKGSTHGRITKVKENRKIKYKILKDLNFKNMNLKMKLSEEKAEKLREILYNDSQFLSSINIIDYSLLIGIHLKEGNQLLENLSGGGGGTLETLGDEESFAIDSERTDRTDGSDLNLQVKGIFSPMPQVKVTNTDGKEGVFTFGEMVKEDEEYREREIEVIQLFFIKRNHFNYLFDYIFNILF